MLKQRKILLFDGHNLLFKYFYGMPPFIKAKNGELVHGALGFIACILRQVKKFSPVECIVCFDSQGPNAKENILESYKGNRTKSFSPGEANPFSQYGHILSCLSELNIPYVESPEGIEADDLIAVLSRKFEKSGAHVLISSSDTDFLQIVSDSISVYKEVGNKEFLFTPQKVLEVFGVLPKQIVDYKSLVGDKSDNIKGVPGIGPKTARKILTHYSTYEIALTNLDKIPFSIAKKMMEFKSLVELNKNVIELKAEAWDNLPEPILVQDLENVTARSVFISVGIW